MSIRKQFGGKSIRRPGAYSKSSQSQSGGAPLGSGGTLLILGESDGGQPGASAGMQSYSSAEMSALIANYVSGPIVDCARAAVNPSKTTGIGGFDEVIVWKTNASTQAQKQLQNPTPANLILMKAAGWGQSGNYLTAQISNGTDTAKQRVIVIRDKKNLITETLPQNAAQAQIQLQYVGGGSACVATITGVSESAKTLTTTCTAASGDNLNVALQNYSMKDLVDYLNAFGGGTKYVATLQNVSTGTITNATELDPITASDIMTAPVSVYRLQNELVDVINQNSKLVTAAKNGIVIGIPAALSESFLTGGARGASSNTSFSNGFDAALAEDCNVILPAISRDATADITDMKTDSSSSYTIASVLAALESHLLLRADIRNRMEAQGNAGFRNASKAACIAQAQSLNSEMIQLSIQDVYMSGIDGSLVWQHPHVHAALCAGLRTGMEIGTPLTHKYLNCFGQGHVVDPVTGLSTGDFNPATDYNTAIDGGILFSEKYKGAVRIVVDCTTYGIDQSFVFNRGSVVQASQYIAKTIRETAELAFVGNKVSNGAAGSVKNAIRNKLLELNDPTNNITTASSDAPKGFVEKTFTVEIQGNTCTVEVEVKPVQGGDFVFISFTLGDITQTA